MVTRRKFIRNTAVGTAGIAVLSKLGWAAGVQGQKISRVVKVVNPDVVDSRTGEVNKKILRQMIDQAVMTLSGKKKLSRAWAEFIPKGKRIGLKINTLGLRSVKNTGWTSHFTAMTDTLTSSLKSTGVTEDQLVIWDRSEAELQAAGYTIQKEPGKTRVIATFSNRRDPGYGYSDEDYPVGDKTSRVARILTDQCDVMINIPLIKDHRIAGFTGSLKQHYGTIDNPGSMHHNRCSGPGIAEVNAIPVIREKQKLILVDGLLGVIQGGPVWNISSIRAFHCVIAGTDPVAVDRIMLDMLEKQRADNGLEPLGDRVVHLGLAQKLGLGTAQPDQIDLIEIV